MTRRASSFDIPLLTHMRVLNALKDLIDYVQEISPKHPVIAQAIQAVQSTKGDAS